MPDKDEPSCSGIKQAPDKQPAHLPSPLSHTDSPPVHATTRTPHPPLRSKTWLSTKSRRSIRDPLERVRQQHNGVIDIPRPSFSVRLKHKRRSRPPRSKSTNSKPTALKLKDSNTTVTSLTSRLNRLRINTDKPALGSSVNGKVRSVPKGTIATTSKAYREMDNLVKDIRQSCIKNIVVMCGAGISTASGIPDFRSPKTGLYNNLLQYEVPYPEAIFDQDYFECQPRPFFTLAKKLYPHGEFKPNLAHYFLRLLYDKDILLRVYTQNIDGLEKMAGLPPEKVVEAHGTFSTASCVRCRTSYQPELVKKIILLDKIPRCQNKLCCGLVKPDIVFFGEDLPRNFYYYLRDFPVADLVLVMGTSLKVEPFAGIIETAKLMVPRVLFNRDAVGPFKTNRRSNDFTVEGDLVQTIREFSKRLGWENELDSLMEKCSSELQAPELPDFIVGRSPHLNESSRMMAIVNSLLLDEDGNLVKKKRPVLTGRDDTLTRQTAMERHRMALVGQRNTLNKVYNTPSPKYVSRSKAKITPDATSLTSSRPQQLSKIPFHAQISMSRSAASQAYQLKPTYIRGLSSSSSGSSTSRSSQTDSSN